MMNKDGQFDEAISRWLEETAPPRLSERVLDATFERTRRSRQQVGWRALLGRIRVARFAPVLGGAVIVLAAVLGLSYYANQQDRGGPPKAAQLPTRSDAWSRASIDSRFDKAQVDSGSLAASSQGLLALLGEIGSDAFELAVSTDGLTWSQVPAIQHPPLGDNVALIQLIGTDRGFMLVVRNDVWTSPDGFAWDRISGPEDPDLRQSEILAVAAGGPGFVAVGSNNTAWYSTDGSDWSLAEVPQPPLGFGGPGYAGNPPTVEMEEVAASGEALVAWGYASAGNGDEIIVESVVWRSLDGRTWTNAHGPQIGSVALAGGPDRGFVATGAFLDQAANPMKRAAFFSSNGENWERATNDLESRQPLNPNGGQSSDEKLLTVDAAAASSAGFVAVGSDGICVIDRCADAEAAIWTSVDGRSWARLPSNDLFRVEAPRDPDASPGVYATSVVLWGSRFVVGGQYDGTPAIWMSDLAPTEGAIATPPAVGGTSAPEPSGGQPAFGGSWEATDPPPDSSHITMELIALADGTYGLTIRDEIASVCSGVSSTMTGIARAAESNTIVVAQPEFACDDGSEAQALSGPPLEERLRNLGFAYDPASDELQDSFALVWSRVAMGP